MTGFHPASITRLTVKYQQDGIKAITDNKYGGNHRNLSFEAEAELLKPFQEKAEKGQIVELSEIKARYEQEVGHTPDLLCVEKAWLAESNAQESAS